MIEFCNKYTSVFALVQTMFSVLSFVAAVIAITLAVKAIKETRELATKKELVIGGGIDIRNGKYIYEAVIYNTGYTAVNVKTIQLIYEPISPLALGMCSELGSKAFIQPQEFFCVDIPIINPKDLENVPEIHEFRIEVIDVEDRIFSKVMPWAMG